MHRKELHTKDIKCKLCEETFDKNSDLEVHIKTCHEESESHECEDCGKRFALQWRLRKHKENHGRIGTKHCLSEQSKTNHKFNLCDTETIQ